MQHAAPAGSAQAAGRSTSVKATSSWALSEPARRRGLIDSSRRLPNAGSAARARRSRGSPSASRRVGRPATRACALRDTFFGHPASVCPGPPKNLAYRAQARRSRGRSLHAAKPSSSNTPARARRPRESPSASRRVGRPATRTCALRDTFFGHPASVCPGPPKNLAHRAQARRSRRSCQDDMVCHEVPWGVWSHAGLDTG